MKWIFATLGLLVLGLILKLSLLIYAMYVLLGVLMLSRFFSRVWTDQIDAKRFCNDEVVEIGTTTECKIAVQNTGRLAVPWMILEDSLSRDALVQMPARIKAEGARVALVRLAPGESKVLSYRWSNFSCAAIFKSGHCWLRRGTSLVCIAAFES